MKNLRMADCCQTCAWCVKEHPCDDPITYYCDLLGEHIKECDLDTLIEMGNTMLQVPKRHWPPAVLAFKRREEEREQWLREHEVRAGNVCDDFRAKK